MITVHHLITSFLIFLALSSSSIISFTFAETNAAVTDKLIREICRSTRKPSLCLKNLNPLKGKSLHENPVAVLGSNSMNEAQSRANRTADLVWSHYQAGIRRPDVRIKYYNCFLNYKVVVDYLKEAKRCMSVGAPRFVITYIAIAKERVNACDQELMKPPRGEATVLGANGHLKDLCSIISSICETMAKWI